MDKNPKKEQKNTYRILGMLFAAILAAFFVANLAKSDRDSSDLENRSLSQRPAVTWQSVTSGTFMDRYESYASDQFAGRDMFRRIYVVFERIGGRREENGVYLGKNRRLMEDISVPDSGILAEDIEGINSYAQTYTDVNTHILLVPDTAAVYSDSLPRNAVTADQEELFRELRVRLDASVIWLDGFSAMDKHRDEKLYYRTDHHWTTLGAYEVFTDTAGGLGIEDPEEISYESSCASADFNGTLSAASGFLLGMKEELDIFLPEEWTSYLVTYVEEGEKSPSLYDPDMLDTRDKYAVFFGGNHSLIEIDTASEDSRVLLVVKDSFANCYIQFLIPYFSRIIVVDPRYYVGGIDELTTDYGVTDTLFLYSGNTFFTDTNLRIFLSSD